MKTLTKKLIILITAVFILTMLSGCGYIDGIIDGIFGREPEQTDELAEDEVSEESEEPTPSPTPTPTPTPMPTPTPEPTPTPKPPVLDPVHGVLTITFDYVKIPGSASNQYAVWIEDMDGNHIATVFATRWTAQGGFEKRPDSIALWAEKADIASMPEDYVDAISGATPTSGTQTHKWDLRDIDGDVIARGDYRFFVEGTLRWKNYVLYSGAIKLDKEPVSVAANAEYVYRKDDRIEALTSESSENAMIGQVTASFRPAG